MKGGNLRWPQTMMRSFGSLLILFAAYSVGNAQPPQSVIRGRSSSCEAPHGKGNVYAPCIVRHNGSLRMYFGGQGRDGHDRIHLATSSDGDSWNPQGVVFAPAGINHVNDPSVLTVADLFYMYYTRATLGVTDSIGVATSSDGRTWTDRGAVFLPRQSPAWDSLLVGRPCVIHTGEVFRMWYDGRADLPIGAPDPTAPTSPTSQRYVGYAESRDGISWKRHDRPVFARDAGGVHVSRVGGRYLMLFESRDGTRWASSKDGLAWEPKGLLVMKDLKTSPHGHVTPFLFHGAGQYVLYYGAARSVHWNENSIMRSVAHLDEQ